MIVTGNGLTSADRGAGRLVKGRASSRLAELLQVIHGNPIASVITNPRLADNPLIAVNDVFCELTGYRRDDLLGHNCRILARNTSESCLSEAIRRGTRLNRQMQVEVRNYKRDGTPFRNSVLVAPIFDTLGTLTFFVGSQVELDQDELDGVSTRRLAAQRRINQLSPRQRQVLEEIAAGYRSKEISAHLQLSEKTVKMHRRLMFDKLGTHNMAAAVRLAVEAGL